MYRCLKYQNTKYESNISLVHKGPVLLIFSLWVPRVEKVRKQSKDNDI